MDDQPRHNPEQDDAPTEQRPIDWGALADVAARKGYDSTENSAVVPAAMGPDEAVANAEPEPDPKA